ncbi:lsm10, U7 small nuclear RNA associated [Halocaridina rubra]|uniref:Lsm10, U7 small nuclear RNA associated n=1 Tax=Halocaridina rubra TaxID=373956 RepID=A0AAN9AAE0_HALRR
MGLHAREQQHKLNSLACLAMGMQGWKTTIELNNDSYVSGRIVEVDAKMNMEISEARYTDGNGKSLNLDNFHVRGRKIRYVHIPDQVDIMKMLEEMVVIQKKSRKTSVKTHIAQKRTEQTLKRYRRQQEEAAAAALSGESIASSSKTTPR